MAVHSEKALDVRGLTVSYGDVPVVKSVDMTIEKGRIVGLVGESGSGKSTLVSAVIGLLPNLAQIPEGIILFGEQDLVQAGPKEFRDIRGRRISMVSQDPLSALNPVLTIGQCDKVGTFKSGHFPTYFSDSKTHFLRFSGEKTQQMFQIRQKVSRKVLKPY